jgi:hypothetical protein
MNEEQFCRRYAVGEKAGYAFQISANPFVVVDARNSTAGVGRYINEPPKGMAANGRFERHPEFPRVKRLVCRAIKDILIGQEILARYDAQGFYQQGEKV